MRNQFLKIAALPARSARKVTYLLSRELFRSILKIRGVEMGAETQIIGKPIVTLHSNSSIKIGSRTVLCSSSKKTALGIAKPVILRTIADNAFIELGDDVGLSGTVICCVVQVKIGNRCLIGADVTFADTDFHQVSPWKGRRYAKCPKGKSQDAIIVGSDVFIGTGSLILKGVRIGDGAVIGAGSVVTKNVDSETIVAGNPARKIGMVSAL